jgi:predicted RNA-binding protein with PUA-like domain
MWLLKTEPGTYAFEDLEREGKTVWDGVKNPAAQKNLRAMKAGDRVVIYHTGEQKAAVGLAAVTRAAYPDPQPADGRLVVVDLKLLRRLPRPVTLAEIKAHPAFVDSPLLRQGRLSVVLLTPAQAKVLDSLAAGGAR